MITVLKKIRIILNGSSKKRLIIVVLLSVLNAFTEALGVSIMVPLVTALLDESAYESGNAVAFLYSSFGFRSHVEFLTVCIVSLMLVFVVKNLIVQLYNMVRLRFVYSTSFSLKQKLLHTYINRPYEFYLSVTSADVYQRVSGDVDRGLGVLMTFIGLFTELIICLFLAVTVFFISPEISAFVSGVLLVTALVLIFLLQPKVKSLGREVRQGNISCNLIIFEAIKGIKDTKVARREEYFEQLHKRLGQEKIGRERKYSQISGITRSVTELSCVLSFLAVLLVKLKSGDSLVNYIPALSAFALAAMKIMPATNVIVSAVNTIAYESSSLDKLAEGLSLPPAEALPESSVKELDRIIGNIELKGITYHYPGNDRNVLEAADMLIPAGKSIGLVGASGNGKTTTVDLLLGLLKPCSGQIIVNGAYEITGCQSWGGCIGYIPQSIFLLNGTIGENICFGRPADPERLQRVLEEAQLLDFVGSLPKGAETEIGEMGIRLSGGQRQRVGIARALYSEPQLLVFDEATSSLDNDTEREIISAVNRLQGSKTLIIIAHRLNTVENCDMIYRVENGKIKRER